MTQNILLIGCGKMGSAMLQGWLSAGITEHIDILDPAAQNIDGPVTLYPNAGGLPQKDWDVVVLAVKPQIMEEVCTSVKDHIKPSMPVLSIAAGQTITGFQTRFDGNQPIIRAMPNTPAAIGKGITVACPSAAVSDDHQSMADSLLAPLGETVWVDDESLLDPVTAVSGSGPAYVFYLMEMLAAAGEKSGLPADLSMQLARQTVIGAAALAENDDSPASVLRENVTSPGGTTEAALEILMDGKMQDIFDQAIQAATGRSKKLSS